MAGGARRWCRTPPPGGRPGLTPVPRERARAQDPHEPAPAPGRSAAQHPGSRRGNGPDNHITGRLDTRRDLRAGTFGWNARNTAVTAEVATGPARPGDRAPLRRAQRDARRTSRSRRDDQRDVCPGTGIPQATVAGAGGGAGNGRPADLHLARWRPAGASPAAGTRITPGGPAHVHGPVGG